eukprot:6853991-Prymnesium_polylepis.1
MYHTSTRRRPKAPTRTRARGGGPVHTQQATMADATGGSFETLIPGWTQPAYLAVAACDTPP